MSCCALLVPSKTSAVSDIPVQAGGDDYDDYDDYGGIGEEDERDDFVSTEECKARMFGAFQEGVEYGRATVKDPYRRGSV